MTQAIKALLHRPLTAKDSETLLPVLMFTAIGLAVAIAMMLSVSLPPLADFDLF